MADLRRGAGRRAAGWLRCAGTIAGAATADGSEGNHRAGGRPNRQPADDTVRFAMSGDAANVTEGKGPRGLQSHSSRHDRALSGQCGLDKYAGTARRLAVGVYDGRNGGGAINRPNNRARTRRYGRQSGRWPGLQGRARTVQSARASSSPGAAGSWCGGALAQLMNSAIAINWQVAAAQT